MNKQKMIQELREFSELMRILYGFLGVWKPLLIFIGMSIVALLFPEDRKNWRFAWMYFVFPMSFIAVALLGTIILFVIFPRPFDWMLSFVWCFYMIVIEPYAYYIAGNGFERSDWWIEHDGEDPPFPFQWREEL